MKQLYFLILIVFTAVSSEAQEFRYTVNLRYKGSDAYSLTQPSAFLSQKAIQRRLTQKIKIDSTDLPVNPQYINAIANVPNVTVLIASKWLNQLLISTDDIDAITTIEAFPFVAHATAVAATRKNRNGVNTAALDNCNGIANNKSVKKNLNADVFDYGSNYTQVHMHEGEYLHNKGFAGQGITIAILDGGFFEYTTNPALDSVRNNHQVLGSYDFVNKEISVDEDHFHGANCFSILASNRPGFIIGTAPKASYWLFRTEDVASEAPIEEYNWIAGAERADSAGADMISSSLGYVNFDDPSYNHSYLQRDGNTAAVTIGADMAAKKGMIVVNAAGNSGNNSDDTKYVMCPADGDSVLSVGAVKSDGTIAGFSSWGPTGNGKMKPGIVSMGEQAVYANPNGDPGSGNGTSYSTPNIAGLIACLWQAFYEFTNMEIIDAVEKSADHFNNPDDRYGFGIPNFRVAFALLEAKRQARADAILNGKWLTAYPVPFRQAFTISLKAPNTGTANIRLFDMTGRLVLEKSIQVRQGSLYTLPMNATGGSRYSVYYLQYSDGQSNATVKLVSL